MKSTGNFNINTRNYWNTIYGDEFSRATYAAQGTDEASLKVSDHIHANAVHTKRFKTALDKVNKGDRVCDIGCGVGVFTKMVKEKYRECEVWGVDISDKAIESNKKESPDIIYHHGYIGSLNMLPDDYFDVIFCGETIEHLDEPRSLFDEAFKKLKDGGRLIITTPREDKIKSDEHLWTFTNEDVETLFFASGFKNVEFTYLPDMEHLVVIFATGAKE